MMLKKIVCLVTILSILIVSAPAISKGKMMAPPYPEVWGYDLSTFPAIKWGLASVEGYPMDDGDVWFVVTHSYDTKPSDFSKTESNFKYVLIKFFKKEQIELSEKGRHEVFKIIEQQKTSGPESYDQDFFFKDGSKFKFYSNPVFSRWFSPDFYDQYFLKTDSKGNQKKYSILVARPQVKMWLDGGLGEIKSAPFFYQKLYLLTDVLPLKDDTFLVFANGSNVILRLNKAFQTKFKPVEGVQIQGDYIKRNFFVIDYAVIEHIESKYPGESLPYYQYIHDELLSQFNKEYNK